MIIDKFQSLLFIIFVNSNIFKIVREIENRNKALVINIPNQNVT